MFNLLHLILCIVLFYCINSCKLKKNPINYSKPAIQISNNDKLAFNELKYSSNNNTNNLAFRIYGNPLSLARHRTAKQGFMYNPSAKFQKQFLDQCLDILPNKPWDDMIEASIVFYFKRPLLHYKTGKLSNELKDKFILPKDMYPWYGKKKDLDNMIKFVLDSLNGKAFVDDSQICIIHSAKVFTNNEPHTDIRLKKLNGYFQSEDKLDIDES